MSKSVIEIKKLSKAYMIGHEQQAMAGTMTFRDSLTNLVRKPLELITGHQLKKEKFWALKDVTLNIEQGDVVGIIGRNGSGKSTLLKVLSRIVEPTKGEAVMRGRVASLLEVGTGFHPELTGRENVFFNGAILGMSRKEINAKFDEIVAFSEVEKFLDTPVKFYSSGMYVRLAFAVAAHLDPDILIVDEVLAVGDAAFQKKCLGKMKDVAGQGRTVLFVSHSMATIQSLCTRGVLMKDGKVVSQGSVQDVVEAYSGVISGTSGRFDNFQQRREGAQDISIKSIELSHNGSVQNKFDALNDVELAIKCKTRGKTNNIRLDLNLYNDVGVWIACFSGRYSFGDKGAIKVYLPDQALYQGQYSANISLLDNEVLQDFIPEAISFVIKPNNSMISGVSGVIQGLLK